MDSEKAQNCHYQITAHGVYRCVKYLKNLTFYADENGWIGESVLLQGKYSYRSISDWLHKNYSSISHIENGMWLDFYDGEILWNSFFLADPYFASRIKKWGLTSIDQLHWYASNAANRRK